MRMKVFKRTWPNAKGGGSCWAVRYGDKDGVRRQQQPFRTKADADDWAARTAVQLMDGIHIAPSTKTNVMVAAICWVRAGEAEKLERTTLDQRLSHMKNHIEPFFRDIKLTAVTTITVREFQAYMRANGSSDAMVRKVTTSLFGILSEALERQMIAVHPMAGKKKKTGRGARKVGLRIGVDVPSPDEVQRLFNALAEFPDWRPLILTAALSGLRTSELRGLSWDAVNLTRGSEAITVQQRADRYRKMGPPKSKRGARTVPIGPLLANTLREWKLVCPRGAENLVFPDEQGRVLPYWYPMVRALHPTLLRAGITKPDGTAKYGMHALRHFYASWCLNSASDGGLGYEPQKVQALLGHYSITMTMDIYGHLFPRKDSGQLAAGEAALWGH